MSTYFPFLRGKREELFALRVLAARIAAANSVIPIVEPVNANSTTMNCLDAFVEVAMPFVWITNPKHGKYKGRVEELHEIYCVNGPLVEYDNYIPALYVYRDTNQREVDDFNEKYESLFRAVIYDAEPTATEVRDWCVTEGRIYHQVYMEGKVSAEFIENMPLARQVIIRDNFRRQARNSDYPNREHFTSLNTVAGNRNNVNWGDFSIQGDHYADGGGAAMTVAIHHIHFSDNGSSLDISHYLSDRQETTDDPAGKTIEAAEKLVADLDSIAPNDTTACGEYRAMVESGHWRGLGYLKRLAIMNHLEIMLRND
jgi:hypothetical protein